MHRCFNEDKDGELLDSCDSRLLKRLVICVLKVEWCMWNIEFADEFIETLLEARQHAALSEAKF